MSSITDIMSVYCAPSDWLYKNYENGGSYLVPLDPFSAEYRRLAEEIESIPRLRYCNSVTKIERVQNIFLYSQFLIKQEEYKSRNIDFKIEQLLHDTAACNVESIVQHNFDWRFTSRSKFGRGVSFSPSAAYANKQSSRLNGFQRAMIVTDVLIGSTENGRYRQKLPKFGDTTVGNKGKVYVKYYDDEFYPKYVIYYNNF